MIVIPVESKDHKSDAVIVILDSQNFERMKEADPAQIPLHNGKHGKRLINPLICICYEEMTPEMETVLKSGNPDLISKFLTRGFKFRPELGDHDDGFQKL